MSKSDKFETRPTGLGRIVFDVTHPISFFHDIGMTNLSDSEVDQYYRMRYNVKSDNDSYSN